MLRREGAKADQPVHCEPVAARRRFPSARKEMLSPGRRLSRQPIRSLAKLDRLENLSYTGGVLDIIGYIRVRHDLVGFHGGGERFEIAFVLIGVFHGEFCHGRIKIIVVP